MKILHIDSSILADNSASRQLTSAMVSQLQANVGSAQIKHLDLAEHELRPLNAETLGFRLGVDDAHLSEEQLDENKVTRELIDQLKAADVLVIGAPMYNFTIPTQLKNWIDRVAQAGETFKYTEQGSVGLVTGKKVYILSTRGGLYSTTPEGQKCDHQESLLQTVLGFMGMTNITTIRAEKLAMGDEARSQGISEALAQIAALEV